MHLFFSVPQNRPPPTVPTLKQWALLLNSPFAKLGQLTNLEVEARLKLIFCQVSKFGGIGGDGVHSGEHQSLGKADAQQGDKRGEEAGALGGRTTAVSQHRAP